MASADAVWAGWPVSAGGSDAAALTISSSSGGAGSETVPTGWEAAWIAVVSGAAAEEAGVGAAVEATTTGAGEATGATTGEETTGEGAVTLGMEAGTGAETIAGLAVAGPAFTPSAADFWGIEEVADAAGLPDGAFGSVRTDAPEEICCGVTDIFDVEDAPLGGETAETDAAVEAVPPAWPVFEPALCRSADDATCLSGCSGRGETDAAASGRAGSGAAGETGGFVPSTSKPVTGAWTG